MADKLPTEVGAVPPLPGGAVSRCYTPLRTLKKQTNLKSSWVLYKRKQK